MTLKNDQCEGGEGLSTPSTDTLVGWWCGLHVSVYLGDHGGAGEGQTGEGSRGEVIMGGERRDGYEVAIRGHESGGGVA